MNGKEKISGNLCFSFSKFYRLYLAYEITEKTKLTKSYQHFIKHNEHRRFELSYTVIDFTQGRCPAYIGSQKLLPRLRSQTESRYVRTQMNTRQGWRAFKFI